MEYATVEDLKQRLGNRYQGLYKAPEDADAIADIEMAESEVNIHLQNRVALPISNTRILACAKNWTLTLVEELAYSRNVKSDENKKIAPRVKSVRDTLEKIASGVIRLGGEGESPSNGAESVIVSSEDPVFKMDNLKGF